MAEPRPFLARLAALLVLASASAGAAENGPSIAGRWVFETAEATANQCVIRGTASLTPNGDNQFRIALTTHEECRSGDSWRSVQNCIATRAGAALEIDCTIVRAEPSNYAEDNFALTVRSSELMEGALISTWEAPVRWRRPTPDLVS